MDPMALARQVVVFPCAALIAFASAAVDVEIPAGSARLGDKVLVLTRDPASGADVEQALRAWRALHGRPDDVQVDLRLLRPLQSERELASGALTPSHRYRAVYATTTALAYAVQQTDPKVPLVFRGGANPVAACLVDSAQHPGRSATGFTSYLPSEGQKTLEALLDGFPGLRRVYFVVGGSNVDFKECVGRPVRGDSPVAGDANSEPCVSGAHEFGPYMQRRLNEPAAVEAGRRRNVDVRFLLLCGPADYTLLRSVDSPRDDVGYVVPWQFMHTGREQQIVDLVASAHRPAIYGRTRFTELGGLMALETLRDPGDERRAIDMLIQVLDGRPPATLPVQMPRGFRLTVNAVAAADMQLRPSLSLLRRADDIIVRKSTDR